MKKAVLLVSLLAVISGASCSKGNGEIEFPQEFNIGDSKYIVVYPDESGNCLIKMKNLKRPEDILVSTNSKNPPYEVTSIDDAGIHIKYTSGEALTFDEGQSPYVYVNQRLKSGASQTLTSFTLRFFPTPVKVEMVVSHPGLEMSDNITIIGTDRLVDDEGILHLSPLQIVKPQIRLTDANGKYRDFMSNYADYSLSVTSGGKNDVYVEDDGLYNITLKVREGTSSKSGACLKMSLRDHPEWSCSQEIMGHPSLEKLHIIDPSGKEITKGSTISLKGEQTLTVKPEPEDACAICTWTGPHTGEGGKYRYQIGSSAKFANTSTSTYTISVMSLAGWDHKFANTTFYIVKQ